MDQESIGKFIAKLRKEKNLTQQDLAEKLGTTDKSISRWENGKCMPDLSLLPLLSKELNVTVNDLMSGEKVDKKEYQEVFEENVVKTIAKVDKSNSNWNILKISLVGIIVLFIFWFLGYIYYVNYAFFQKYDSKTMLIEQQGDGDLWFIKSGNGMLDYLLIASSENNEDFGLVFVRYEKTLENYHQDIKNNSQSDYIDLRHQFSGKTGIKISSDFPIKYKVYYTNVSFKKIRKAKNEELKKIIKKSNLMYENK